MKAVIFDMDGVLLDTETICAKTWLKSSEEFNINEIEKAFSACIGCNKKDTIQTLKQLYPQIDAEKFIMRTSELFTKIEEKEGIALMKGVDFALNYLKQRGIRIALASSTRSSTVKRQLTNAGIIDFFETITTGDMVLHSKPDPEIYRLACASLNLKENECAAIEDSPNGIKSAWAAGLKTVMIPDRINPDKELIPKIWKLLNSLENIDSIF